MSIRRVHYAWIMVAVIFLATVAAGGARSMPGVLIIPLEQEFGWDRTTISLAISINLFLYGLCGPFASAISDRVGLRRIVIATFLTLGVGVGLTTLMEHAWQLQLLWGVVVGLATGTPGAWMAASVANRWFVERRGLASGLLLAGAAAGQIVFLPLLASVIVTNGWRLAALIVAGIALLVVPLAAKYVRNHPHDVGLQPYGTPAEETLASGPGVPQKPTGNPFVAALATLRLCIVDRNFLLLAGSFFACGASANGLIGTHLIPASIEHGIPEVTAASFFSAMAVLNIVGTTASGWLSDRLDCRRLLAWYYGFRGLALIFLPFAFTAGYPGLIIFITLYGLEWAATAVPTMRLTADLFGKNNVGTVFGWMLVSHQLGAAAISFAAGALRTWLGDYHIAFMVSGFICMLGAMAVSSIPRPPDGDSQPGTVPHSKHAEDVMAPAAKR